LKLFTKEVVQSLQEDFLLTSPQPDLDHH
jgi:hypothetical protein